MNTIFDTCKTENAENKILIADDEKRAQILISDFLNEAGYNTVIAGDGAEAIDIFTEDKHINFVTKE